MRFLADARNDRERIMPELPEVETIRLGLKKYLVGHQIESAEVRNPRVFHGAEKEVAGVKIKNVRRFGKLLVIDLSNGNSLTIHVKMTGQLIYRGPNLKEKVQLSSKVIGGIPGPHTHVIFKLNKKGVLYFNDFRRFGWIKVMQTAQVEKEGFASKLGPEPFKDLTLQKFKQILSKYKTYIKVVLMDQTKIAGVGNIYANESLWMSRINPGAPGNSLSEKQAGELYANLLAVLKKGIKYGGASENIFVTSEGKEGNFQKHFQVYAQKGKFCPRCKKSKIVKSFLGGRGTFTCLTCQKF